MPITHTFVSAVSDGGDATLVRPSDWNALHVPSEDWDTAMAAIAGSDLVHRWKFDEASGDFADSIGSLTLTAGASATYQVASPVGYGASRAGGNLATSSALTGMPTAGGDRTYIMVFKAGVTNAERLLWQYGTLSTRQWQHACINHDGIAQGPCYLAFSDDHKPAGFLADDHWHMVAWRSRDRAGEVWLDGSVHSSRAWGAALNTTSTTNITIGTAGVTVADWSVFTAWMSNVDLLRLWETIKDSMDV